MNFVLTGDWHLTDNRPKYRTDQNYLATAMDKVRFLRDMAERADEEAIILQPGDLFDSPRASYSTLTELVRVLHEGRARVYTTLGQHDVHFHHLSLINTPAGLLRETLRDMIHIGGGDEPEFTPVGDVSILFRAWGTELPTPKQMARLAKGEGRRVVVMHAMVTNSGTMWKGQQGNLDARTLLEDYPMIDLWVCGDNHRPFVVSEKGRHVVNCGSLLRTNIDQLHHRPRLYIWDSESGELERVWVPGAPGTQVFDVSRAQLAAERNERLGLFLSNLQEGRGGGSSFKDNLEAVLGELPRKERAAVEPYIREALRNG